jgi:putative transposase
VFIDDEDRCHYLRLLERAVSEHDIKVHAYVLMDNHVHLLATGLRQGAIASALRRLAQCHVQSMNRKHRRSGTLWEGRFKSCLVGSERYLLSVYRYIELNPVRARMVERPEQHAWSSVHANAFLRSDAIVSPHRCFLALATEALERAACYRSWLSEGVDEELLAAIRVHLAQERAYGDRRFQEMVERTLNRPATVRPRGRPRKTSEKEAI